MPFDAAFKKTLGVEGAYSNDPADPGGETMWGITVAVARRNGYLGPMKSMPIDTAKAIYRSDFWNLIHLDTIDAIDPAIAEEMFDTGVNCGAGVPVPFLQRALNAFNRQGADYPDMPVDGLFGKRSADALRAFLQRRGMDGRKVLLAALNAQQGVRYLEIVEKRPTSEKYAFGWFLNRVVNG